MDILTGISLFSGAGGLDIAAKQCGIRTVCYVENDRYAQAVLISRIRSGDLHDAPIWDDVKTFDGKPFSGKVDIIFGGFPCQDISVAGKGAGIKDGQKSGLWKEFNRIICEIRPRFIVVENVPALISRGIDIVLGNLAQNGYDAEWEMLSACSVGAPHMRKRVFIVGDSNGIGWYSMANDKQKIRPGKHHEVRKFWRNKSDNILFSVVRKGAVPSPGVHRVDDGLAEELDRFRLCGNGVVPQVAIKVFEKIISRL
jgi:DNA (cytosine-5)-methyltransferase 1